MENNSGFTLIETIIIIFIFTLTMGALFGTIVILYRTHNYTLEQSQATYEARKGIETMVKEIREAETADDGSYPIVSADDYQFVFYSNIDDDPDIERVRYFLDDQDNELKKGVINPSGWPPEYLTENEAITTVAHYVVNEPPIFRYYDGEGEELPAPARKKDTKMMGVYLVINVNPKRTPQNSELISKVQLRNLKNEY